VGLIPSLFTVKVAMAPLPLPFLIALKQIEVETSLEEASVFRLHFELSQTALGDWDVLQFDIFRPLVPVSISVMLGKFLPEVLINGYVHDASLDNRSQPGASTLDVVGMDASATLMNLMETPMPHPNMPDSVIATTIFARYAMVPMAFPPTPSGRTVMDTTTTQRVTDIQLLREMAERNAYECYVQPDPILGTDVGHFHPPQTMLPTQGVLSTNFGMATNMDSFHVSNAMLQPTGALASWLDPSMKSTLPAPGLASTEPPLGLEPSLTRIVPPPLVRPAATFSANYAEVLANSMSIANRSSRNVRGTGTVDGLKYGKVLRAGQPVAVRGAGREHSGNYYVTRVTHTISIEEYTQNFEASRNAVGLTGAEIFIDPMAALT
jgi:hypothetical protein